MLSVCVHGQLPPVAAEVGSRLKCWTSNGCYCTHSDITSALASSATSLSVSAHEQGQSLSQGRQLSVKIGKTFLGVILVFLPFSFLYMYVFVFSFRHFCLNFTTLTFIHSMQQISRLTPDCRFHPRVVSYLVHSCTKLLLHMT